MPTRLSRQENQARTRACLLESATRIFARRGLAHASIEEVAQDAGFTKGAFYANFASKEELFLAMLDERFAERLAEIDRVLATEEDPERQTHRAGVDFVQYLSADPEWQRLFFEFAAHASRHEDFRQALLLRYRRLRERIAGIYEQRLGRLDVAAPIPVADIALMTFAMANGVALEQLVEPEAVTEELYGRMLAIFFAGLRSMIDATAAVPAAE